MTKEELLVEIKQILSDIFDVEEDKVTMEANIVTDLDLDSIDAIDMVAELQRRCKCRFSAEDFKSVKTIGDVIDVIVAKIENN
ncbi:MAG: acyl carrier protein [Ruminobacter sp.]|nr:acyl carrier protein [Ruminobacter sp.]